MFAAILKVFKESVGIVGIHMKIMSENMENPVIGISCVRLFFFALDYTTKVFLSMAFTISFSLLSVSTLRSLTSSLNLESLSLASAFNELKLVSVLPACYR